MEVRDSAPHEVAAYELLRNKIHKHRIVLAEEVHLTLGETLRKVKRASDSLSFRLTDQSISVVSKELKDTVGM